MNDITILTIGITFHILLICAAAYLWITDKPAQPDPEAAMQEHQPPCWVRAGLWVARKWVMRKSVKAKRGRN